MNQTNHGHNSLNGPTVGQAMQRDVVSRQAAFQNYRSLVYSILKTGYGWPSFFHSDEEHVVWESWIEARFYDGQTVHETAQALAIDWHNSGGNFSQRLDGKPNRLTVAGVAV